MPNTPNTDIYLINAPLTIGDGRQIDFASATAQANYFAGLPHLFVEDATYQRREGKLRVPYFREDLNNYNYLMYRNSNGKRIFAYITDMEYLNDECTAISFVVDYFQTWLFQMNLRPCLVIREHTATDLPYEHTVPENLDAGIPIEVYRQKATPVSMNAATAAEFDANFRVMFCFTQEVSQLHQTATPYPQKFLGGMPAGVYYYAVGRADVQTVVDIINQHGLADAIVCAYTVPIAALDWETFNTSPYVYIPSDLSIADVSVYPPTGWTIPHGSGVTTIKNRKCLSYPFHYYKLTTFSGKTVDLKTELFYGVSSGDPMKFATVFSGQVGAQMLVCPKKYANLGSGATADAADGKSFAYSVEYTDFPQVPTTSDVFKNYAALNASKIGMEKAGIFIDAAKSMVKADSAVQFLEGAAGGAFALAQMQANFNDMQRIPDRIQGTPGGSTLQQAHGAGVFLCEMSTRPEYMRQIDDYFTMFGYKVNRLKTPSFKTRPHWNYLQTANADVGGDIPAADAEELQKIFNAGLTVWHYASEFGTYDADNRVSV